MSELIDKPRGAFLFLLIGGLLMFAVGVLFLARPTILTSGMGVGMESAAARTDIRAVYGGFEVAIGVFMIWASRRAERMQAGLMLAACIALGAAGGRVVGFVIEGSVDGRNLLWGTLEFAGGLAAVWFMGQLVARKRDLGSH